MTHHEAINNIGQPFRMIDMFKPLPFDTIISVDQDGTIHGKFLEAHCTDCRLKQQQPAAFKKHTQAMKKHIDNLMDLPGAPDTDSNGMCFSDADPGL